MLLKLVLLFWRSNDNPTITAQSKSADEIYGELVVKTLGEIKYCEEKDLIKLEIEGIRTER